MSEQMRGMLSALVFLAAICALAVVFSAGMPWAVEFARWSARQAQETFR